jgi:hypothetical protein
VNRWPLDDRLERTFLEGYVSSGGQPQAFLRHRSFWIAAALATSAEYRWQQPARLRSILAAMCSIVRRPELQLGHLRRT